MCVLPDRDKILRPEYYKSERYILSKIHMSKGGNTMALVPITVADGTLLSTSSSEAILTIEVTNTNLIPSADETNAYYYVELSDGTNTETYTFVVPQTGPIGAGHVETFVVTNTLDEVTDSSGVIYYSMG